MKTKKSYLDGATSADSLNCSAMKKKLIQERRISCFSGKDQVMALRLLMSFFIFAS